MKRGVVLLIIISFFIGSCVSFKAPLRDEAELKESTDGIVYGRFSIVPESRFLMLKMGLLIKNQTTGKTYTIPFVKNERVYATSIEAGSYSIEEIVTATGEGVKSGTIKLDAVMPQRTFLVKAGIAYYIGDYSARTSSTTIVLGAQYVWTLDSVKNNFAATSEEMDKQYPFLRRFPKENAFSAFTAESQNGPMMDQPKVRDAGRR